MDRDMEARLEALAKQYGFRKAEGGQQAAAPAPAARESAGSAAKRSGKNPTRRENELMLNLMVVRNGLVKYGPDMRERCREAGPTVWRDLRLMTVLCERVQEALLGTMPDKRLAYYETYRRHGHYVMEMSGPVRTPRQILISDTHLGAVCDAALRGVCVLCMKEGKDVEKCCIREALLEVAPPTQVIGAESRFAECEYRNAARQLDMGEVPEV